MAERCSQIQKEHIVIERDSKQYVFMLTFLQYLCLNLNRDKHCVSPGTTGPFAVNRDWINQVQPNKHFSRHHTPVPMATPIFNTDFTINEKQ